MNEAVAVASFERHQNWKSVFDPLTTEVRGLSVSTNRRLWTYARGIYDLPDGDAPICLRVNNNDGPSCAPKSISWLAFRVL